MQPLNLNQTNNVSGGNVPIEAVARLGLIAWMNTLICNESAEPKSK